jgi:hypothetical protein
MFCARGPEASSKARQACTSPDHAATPSPLGLYMVWPFRNPDHLFANKKSFIALRKMMGAVMTYMNLGRDEDDCISEELLARLHNASVLALVATFRADDRARLAHLCYRKTHLRPIGLAIGSTCGLRRCKEASESIIAQ